MFTESQIKRPVRAVLCAIAAVLLFSPLSARAATPESERKQVMAGGMTFGVRLETEGVLVVGLSDTDGLQNPAKEAGIAPRDIITAINGTPVNHVEEVTAAIEGCEGQTLRFSLLRSDPDGQRTKETTVQLTPVFSDTDGRYKAGLWIRSSAAGIGTVTYIDPASLSFCGLGHGICDVDTGMLLPLRKGEVYPVTLSGVKSGRKGEPGELQGMLDTVKTGALLGNTVRGVWGVLGALPQVSYSFDTAAFGTVLPLGYKNEVHEGDAVILCTVDGSGTVGKYGIRISKLDLDSDRKNFVITVTDPALLSVTGGIVQGMSGSPIIQDGKLIGAVTHVLVGDPTRGYGIFIENMPRGE